jgi:transcription termination/antitermination protein NusA
MSKEILLVAQTVSNEKGVPKQVIFEAIEEALAVAAQKKHTQEIDARVSIDQVTGDHEAFRVWTVVEGEEDLENPDAQILLSEAQAKDATLEIGSTIEEPLQAEGFGRISAQIAKHIIIQKVREAERAQIAQRYMEKIGDLISGVVKRTTRDYIILDLGANAEGFIPRDQMLPREIVRPGDRVRAYLYEVDPEAKGAQIFLSRTHEQMLVELFRIEVPEIGEDVIKIAAVARDPGARAKIAVSTNDGRIDPIGACVGMRGSRVQAVSGELAGERIDIVLWDDSSIQLVINAMAPAEVASIVVDEDRHAMDIAVSEAFLSQAIGRNGQNVNLAAKLTGWSLNVMSEEQAEEKSGEEAESLVKLFVTELSLPEDVATIIVEEGFSTVEEIAYTPLDELMDMEGLEEAQITAIRKSAKDLLLTKAIAQEEEISAPAKDLLEVEGMDEALARALAAKGVVTREDLAEQAIDDLLEIVSDLSEEKAGELIMTARKIWFEDDQA